MGNANSDFMCCTNRHDQGKQPEGPRPIRDDRSNILQRYPEPGTPMDKLIGTWKVESEDGSLDEYLSLIGVPWVFRKMVVRPIDKQPLQSWSMKQGCMVTGYEEKGDEPDAWPLVKNEVWRNPITAQLTKRSILFQDGVLVQTSYGWVDGHVAETQFFVTKVRSLSLKLRLGYHLSPSADQGQAAVACHRMTLWSSSASWMGISCTGRHLAVSPDDDRDLFRGT